MDYDDKDDEDWWKIVLLWRLREPDRGKFEEKMERGCELKCEWKKRSEETQTLCAGCSKAEPKFFALPQTPFPGALDG